MSRESFSHEEWRPSHSYWLIAFAVMLSTFMEILDASVANVALPHIAGNLSVTNHEATWVLTSYLISNAIVLPAAAWFSGFWGRKRFLMICVIIFTLSSILCGLATSLGFLIFARIIQGAGGGALQPISQAILLESFPREKRGLAMAVFSLGAIVAPIIGPMVGGWITDNFSWRWIFFINIPVGLLSLWLTDAFVEDPPYIKKNRAQSIDIFGFSMMAIGLSVLQVVLDKGQQVDWFSTPWICWSTAIIISTLSIFIFWELRVKDPVVNLRILKNINFATGVFLITILGIVLYGTTVLLPLFLQSLMGYTALQSGLSISWRGIAAFITALMMGRLVSRLDGRLIIGFGLFILGISCYSMGSINLEMNISNIFWPIVGTGFSISSIFIAMSTLSMGTLSKEEMGNATGIFNLMRNIGGSIGIAIMTTILARMSQIHQAGMVSHLTPYDPMYQEAINRSNHLMVQSGFANSIANGLIYKELIRQASVLSYINNFQWFGILCILCVPFVFLFKKVKKSSLSPGLH